MRRAAVLAALLAAGFAAVEARAQSPDAPRATSWLQRRLESGLSSALGGSVRIGRLDVDWTSLAADVKDVVLSVPVEGAPPLEAAIGEGRIKLAWEGLTGIGGGQIHITEVVAKRASFSISREWIDGWRPRPRREGASSVQIRIDRLTVDDATAEYTDARQRVRVRTDGLSLRGDWSTSRRSLVAQATARAAVEAPLFGRPWPADVRGGLRLSAGRLEIFGATARGPGADAEISGNVTWGAGASFTAEGRLETDLGALRPYLPGSTVIAGRVEGPVQIVFAGGAPIRVAAQVTTAGFAIGPVATESARASLTLRPGRLDADRIDGRAYDGSFSGTVGLSFGHAMVLEADLTGRGADVGRLLALAGKPLPIAASADVTFKIVGDPAHPAGWQGGATFDAVPKTGASSGRVAARAKGRVGFGDGRIEVHSDRVEAAAASFALDLVAEPAATPPVLRLTLDGTTRDAGATQRAALTVLDALGVARNRFVTEPLEGSGRLRAAVRAARATRIELTAALRDGSWSGERFDAADVDIAVDDAAVEVKRLDLARGGERASGSLRIDPRTETVDALELHTRGLGIAQLAAKAGLDAPVDGRLDLDLLGFRQGGVFAAAGTASVRAVRVGHETLDVVEGPVRIEGDRLILDGLEARGEVLQGRARVAFDLSNGVAEIDLDRATVRLEACRTLAESGVSARGRLEASGPLIVTREGPTGWLSVAAAGVLIDTGRSGLRELRLGDLAGKGEVTPRGLELSVKASPGAAWTFEAFLGWTPKLPVSAVLYFDDLVVGAGGVFGENADLRLKGQVQADGDLTAPRAMEVNGAFDEVAVRFGPRLLRAVEPFPLRVEGGRFVAGPSRFEGEGARVSLSAAGSLEDGPIEGRFEGNLDLSIVSSFWSDLRAGGQVAFDATLAGTLERPDLRGRLTVQDGRLRVLGYPQTLEHIDALALFEGQTLRLDSFHALQGGGEIDAAGAMEFDGLVPSSFRARFDAANVSSTFPEGFKGTYNGRITVEGTPKGATIAGRLDVVRGLYAKEFDAGLAGGARREFGEAAESPFPRGIRLDLDVVAPGNVWLRNDIAKLEAAGQIQIGGELARPEITGRLSLLPGGTVRYRDVDYRLEYGTLELTDPKRINPYMDLRGRTRVAEYDVTLHVEGTLDKFDYELTSIPPLSSQDIIALLVTGKTLDAISGASAAAALPGDMAAYYFAGLLTSTFGKQIQNSLGIDQIAITPMLLKGESDPTARVTLGKRVSDNVKIVFSQDIGTAQKQTYQVVLDASRRVRLVLESDSETGPGGEVQYSQQFGGTPLAKSAAAADRGVNDAPGPVGSVQLLAEDGAVRTDLIKVAKIKPGKPFDRSAALEGGERIRRALLKEGYLQSEVRTEALRDEAGGGVYRIVYRLTCGPKVAVTLETADGKGKKGLRRTLKAFWRETPYTPELWEEAAAVLLDDLQERGYFAADVAWRSSDGPAGRSVRFAVDRGKPVRLRSIRFEGVREMPLDRIEKEMKSLQKQAMRKRLLRPAVLAGDLAAVRAMYRDDGFTRARLGVPEISLSATGDAADVTVAVDEGPRFAVGEVAFPPDVPAAAETMLRWSALTPGGTFSPRRLAAAEQSIKEKFDERGFPDVTVDSNVALAGTTADVAFDVVTGERKTVGEIAIEGNVVTKNRTIARLLTFGRGDVVSRAKLLESQQRLYRTGLFSSVKLSFAPRSSDDPSVQKVTVKVDEAPPWTLGLGAGYDSEDGPRASFLLAYANLGGRNVGLALQGLASGKDNRLQLTMRHRRVFGNSIDSLASLFFEKSIQTAFTERRASLSLRLEQRPKPRWIRFLRYGIQEVAIDDITDVQGAVEAIFEDKLSNLRLASLGVGLVRDTRDDAFLTSRGGYGSIEGSVYAKPLASQASFAKLFVRGSWTVSFKRGSRFASFLRVGAEQPFADTEIVPLSERFFAGGSNTLRGFALDSVGGLVIQGFNAGGEALLILNQEWHFPIWRSLRGELFLDAGNVYPTLNDFDPTDLRSSAGTGLRLDTPVGAVRVEYGWKLDRREGESAGEFVFAIGAVF